MATKRVKRPKLERDRPRREWSTLFGNAGKEPASATGSEPRKSAPEKNVLSDTVELGYRVIEDYLKQGQQAAQGFGAQGWMGGASGGAPGGSADEMQQMAQRVMQYGWDFAGLWFEMWTRMGGPNGWPMPPMPSGGLGSPFKTSQSAAPQPTNEGREAPSTQYLPVSVSVESSLPTSTSVDLQPGSYAELVVHALRPVDGDGAPIKNVAIERDVEGGGWQLSVVVAPTQRPGTYRAAIVDAATNLPKGSLSVRVMPKKR